MGAGFLLASLCAGAFARRGFPLPPPDRRIGQVDGLRGFLAFMVMAHHFFTWAAQARFGRPWELPSIDFFNELGAGGVGLFFMTTGLVFYPRILKGFAATSWPATYVTRAFRIMPLIVVSVLVVTGIVIARTGMMPGLGYPLRAAHWVFSISQEPLIGDYDSGRLDAYVLWSLHFEWLFYLGLLPIAAWAMDRVRAVGGPSWAVPVLLLLVLAGLHNLRLHDFFVYAPLFAVGMLAYECQRREAIARVARSRLMAPVALACLALGMVLAPIPYGSVMPLFALFFVCVACGNDMLGMLGTAGARVLGECSYSIYILHGTLLALLFGEGAGVIARIPLYALPLVLPVAMVVMASIAAVTFLYVERPMIAVGARLARRVGAGRTAMRPAELEVAP